jgi:hypothetical protein
MRTWFDAEKELVGWTAAIGVTIHEKAVPPDMDDTSVHLYGPWSGGKNSIHPNVGGEATAPKHDPPECRRNSESAFEGIELPDRRRGLSMIDTTKLELYF